MKKTLLFLLFFLITPFMLYAEKTAYVLKIDSAIGPVTYYQVKNTLNLAARKKAEFVILTIDTPGGLLTSTRKIVQEILQSKVPVVGYVSPQGAQCASAGTFIALSCHLLAMAPATNIGAAHPVTLTGKQDEIMKEKIVNDTVSFIKSIATLKKRNPSWAEKTVRESISSTPQEALKAKVIDFIAKDMDELLEKIDGKSVELPKRKHIIKSTGIVLLEPKLQLKEKVLKIISDPNIAYILLIIGIWGIILEFSHPGFGVPGIAGTLCLILAFFGLHTLPLNFTGILLIVISLVLFGIEATTPGFGIFLISGIISFLIGSFMLIKPISETRISIPLILSAAIISGTVIWAIILFAWKTKRKKVTTGKEGLIGETGKTISDISPEGTVFVHGEYWKAQSKSGDIPKNRKVKITGSEGFTLIVEEE